MIPRMRGSQADEPPWETRWWHEVDQFFEDHPDLAHQRPAAERWRDEVLRDPYALPFEAIIEDQQLCFSIPDGVDAVVNWQPMDWRPTYNRRMVLIHECEPLHVPEEN
jgi:hypothetical protein